MQKISRPILSLYLLLVACNTKTNIDESTKTKNENFLEQAERTDFIEKLSIDLNLDGLDDSIYLQSPPVIGDPGQFEKIRIQLSNGADFEFSNTEYWDWIDSTATKGLKNQLPSQRIFCLKQNQDHHLLLFGYPYGCCYPRLSLISLKGDSLYLAYDQDFNIEAISDLNKDGILDIIGRENFYEIYGELDSLNANIGSYAPFKVISLKEEGPQLNEALSKSYNQEHYVYLGLEPDPNMPIAYPKKGFDFRPFIFIEYLKDE
ncbi:hypothetical protein [Croceimicrobium hydrocarbonivorans]|uniref:Lipoprotein n=1 Tax=Croceimicrobium hydrocarbonivorans TaxID=2761580 RepID=A0A7H0VHL1_9FLAO|nr:hypothetical protein [Croceimicrobium hydrocarbonivorans]QNR25209.1 hypothetical protein H4K34_05040 [Croceimicrobium hydrocarbonivorans]